jgi:hypothetical protein
VQTRPTFSAFSRRPRGHRLQHDEAWSDAESSSTLHYKSKVSRTKDDHVEPWDTLTSQYPPQERGKLANGRRVSGTRTNRPLKAYRPLVKSAVSEHPLGRLYGFRGHRLRENAADLNVDSLGSPAEIIVLRETGFHFKPSPEIEQLEVAEKVDILASVGSKRELLEQADVEKNIEEFKPKTKTITWDELQSIQRQLAAGFTTMQITKYIEAFRRRQKAEKEKDGLESRNHLSSAILRQTSWVPGISETSEEFDDSVLRGYRSEALTPKLKLALLMLRQCWQLEAQDVIESIGEVELELRNEELELLIRT